MNSQNGGFGNALQAACYGGDISVVRSLLQAGVNVNLPGLYPITLEALEKSPKPHPEIAFELLVRDADLLCDDRKQWMMQVIPQPSTASWLLRWATVGGHIEVIKKLLEHSSPVVQHNLYEWTTSKQPADRDTRLSYQRQNSVLYEAVYRQHEDIVEVLLKFWAWQTDITLVCLDEYDDEHRTALYWAVFHGSKGIVKLLIRHEVDIHTPGPYGWTPRYWAITNGDEQMLDLLNSRCKPDECARCAKTETDAKMELRRYAEARSVSPQPWISPSAYVMEEMRESVRSTISLKYGGHLQTSSSNTLPESSRNEVEKVSGSLSTGNVKFRSLT